MSFELVSLEFAGPTDKPSELSNAPGVFVLLQELNHSFTVIDFGCTRHLRSELIDAKTGLFLLSLQEGLSHVGFVPISDERQMDLAVENLQNWWNTTTDASVLVPPLTSFGLNWSD